jgi:hypothetical protein
MAAGALPQCCGIPGRCQRRSTGGFAGQDRPGSGDKKRTISNRPSEFRVRRETRSCTWDRPRSSCLASTTASRPAVGVVARISLQPQRRIVRLDHLLGEQPRRRVIGKGRGARDAARGPCRARQRQTNRCRRPSAREFAHCHAQPQLSPSPIAPDRIKTHLGAARAKPKL